MQVLWEYAITPDVFDAASYASDDLCSIHLQHLKEALLVHGLVRDLRLGTWSTFLGAPGRGWHKRGQELLKKLRTQRRLVPRPASPEPQPTDDLGWYREAQASHIQKPLGGIIVAAPDVVSASSGDSLVARVDRLSSASWWVGSDCTLRLRRQASEYERALELVLDHASSLMFIDPHLDPGERRYGCLLTLLGHLAARSRKPLVELHRVQYVGSGRQRDMVDIAEWKSVFERELRPVVTATGVPVEVFIWNDFHDRYLITDLVGILMPNGFDTDLAGSLTTWSRMGRKARDDVQAEFHPNAGRHVLQGGSPFRIG